MPEIHARSTATRTRIARAAKAGDAAAEVEARRDHAEVRIAEYVERVLASAPPLSDEQKTRLAELLRGAR